MQSSGGTTGCETDGRLRLNLGCGRQKLPGWENYDQDELDLEISWSAWGIAQDSVDEVLLSHVLEHLSDPLFTMLGLWEIAKPGCKLTIRVPHGASDDAWEDPTHRRPYFLQSFGYFSQPYWWRYEHPLFLGDWQPETVTLIVDNKYAGVNAEEFFERTKHERNLVREMVAVLRAVKPARENKRELMVLPEFKLEALPCER